MNSPIRVLCVDDSVDLAEVFAASVGAEHDMESVGILTTADRLCEEIEARHADIVVIDLSMPGRDPLDAIADATTRCPDSRALVVSGHNDPETVDAAIERGAWGFVSKHHDIEHLLKAIREVAKGQVFIDRV